MAPSLPREPRDANEALKSVSIAAHMRRTFGPQVIENFGGFAGLFALYHNGRLFTKSYRKPVLVACAQGVGAKLALAAACGKHDSIGRDLVAANVNTLLALGAAPLFFLDYFAPAGASREVQEAVLKGMADACKDAGCALLGGDLAPSQGVCQDTQYALAGFAVGIVERRRLIDAKHVRPGHVVIAIAADGLHTTGLALAQRVLLGPAAMKLGDYVPELGITLGEELLKPTRLYSDALRALKHSYTHKRVPTAIAPITDGGLLENLPRALPAQCQVRLHRGSWPEPPIFGLIQARGEIGQDEMFRNFNMGIGLALIVPPHFTQGVLRRLRRAGEKGYVIGEVLRGRRDVVIA